MRRILGSLAALTLLVTIPTAVSIVRTDGAHMTSGIVSDVTPLYARTLGAALVQR